MQRPIAVLRQAWRDPLRVHLADVLLALVVCWIAAAIYLSHSSVGNALSSDNVMPYVLFDDAFHRSVGLRGFYWPESPFYFPDTALTWLLYAIAGSLAGAVGAYAWIASTIFVLLVRTLLLRAGVGTLDYARAAWLIFLILWFAIGLTDLLGGTRWFGQFYAEVFVPENHSGTLLGVLGAFAIVFGDNARRARAWLLLLAALCVAVLLSDRLFEIQFVIPAIGYCAWRMRNRSHWHGRAAILLVMLLVGAEALRWLFPSDTLSWVSALAGSEPGFQLGGDPTMRIGAAESLARMLAGFREIVRSDPVISALELLAIAATATIVIGPLLRARNPGEVTARHRAILVMVIVASVMTPILASIVLGRHIAIHAFRYCQTVALLLVPLALVLAARLRAMPASAWPLWFAAALVAIASPVFVTANRNALYAFEHDQETCLRDLAARKNLKFGVAEFWHALEMTARFPVAPVTAPLSQDAGPRMSMVTNIGWFGAVAEHAADLPTLDFVDEYSYAPALLDAVFGKPSERVECPRSAYRLYSHADGALSRLYRHFDWMPGQILQRLKQVTLPAAAWAANDAYIDGDAIHANAPLAPATPLLVTAQDFPAGKLEIWLAYSLLARNSAATAQWNVSALDDAGNAVATLGQAALAPAGQIVQVALPLGARPPAAAGVGLSVSASGDVDVRIVAIGIRVAK